MIEFDESLYKNEKRSKALEVLKVALEAVDPANAVEQQVKLEGQRLRIGERTHDLDRFRNIYVVGGGKASSPMAKAVEGILGDRLTAGVINVKYGYTMDTDRIELNEAGHPIPDDNGVKGVRKIVELLNEAGEDDLVICLISGGGSALMPLPSEGISLADMKKVTDLLLKCGATINEINAIRKHISQIKGGQLARLAYPAKVISLIMSDVVGSPLDVIASGPTVPDTTTFEDAYQILEKYDLVEQLPASLRSHIRSGCEGEIPETPKEDDPIFAEVYNLIVGDNEVAALAALNKGRELGFDSLLLSTFIEGEAREVGKVLASIAKEILNSNQPVKRPGFIVAGGETTVTIRGRGKGGRNQELALASAIEIAGLDDVIIIGAATDGTDGPTDATGALAEGSTLRRAEELGYKASDYLKNNDSYTFFEALGDLLITGPTNTNVNDLAMIFVF